MLNNEVNSKLGERKLRVNRVMCFFVKARQSLNIVTDDDDNNDNGNDNDDNDDDDNSIPFKSSSFKLITIFLISITR